MKHSPLLPLASIVLRVLVVLNWLFGALILTLLLASFQAEQWTFRALGVGAAAGHEPIVAGMRGIMVLGILGVPLAFVVLRTLLKIVASVREGAPFSLENAIRLRTIAWAQLGLELLHFGVIAIARTVSTREVPLRAGGQISVSGLLAVLLLFVLAQVFLEGARMRDDLEGTV